MSNRLRDQSSPYLLQHAENPVEWYPWGTEAFEKAQREDKPVFLSIGYSTCHWCHVMEKESFENTAVAEILNRDFVSIKVDREERPDIDHVYMSVCYAMTGSGGWPLSIIMTPDQKPFFAGTYFAPETKGGIVGIRDLLTVIAGKWKNNRKELVESAELILAQLKEEGGSSAESIDDKLPEEAIQFFSARFDEEHGGFGDAPKFPIPHNLIFQILYAAINGKQDVFRQVKVTLEKMRRGGIFDHFGFGFSRYSTDKYYLVPHFEKMLYDNALLMIAYTAAYKMSGEALFLDTAEKTAAYLFRDMLGEDGGFYSAQDADCRGEEGGFYVWDYEEVIKLLGEERGRRFCEYFGITKEGNFEGKNIPNLLNRNEIFDSFEGEKELLYEYRKFRLKLHTDDKILTSWNSLVIYAMAFLYRATGNLHYLAAAKRVQQFIEKSLAYDNTLYVSFRDHIRFVKGFLDEYAYYTAALIQLYEATSDGSYLERAEEICAQAGRQFKNENGEGYFLYGTENDSLIMHPKETYDGALPSGNSVMAYCLVRLSQLTGKEMYQEEAKKQLAFLAGKAEDYPAGNTMFFIALLFYSHPPQTITVVLAEHDISDEIRKCLPLYADVRILKEEEGEYKRLNGKTTFYVCRDFTCLPPTNQLPSVICE